MEQFIIIKDFPNYKINCKGEVINIKTNKVIKHVYNDGYPVVNLEKDKRRLKRRIHVLLMELFKEPKPSKNHVVNHINGIRSDFSLENLEWCTQKENIHHSRKITKNGAVISSQKIKHLYEENQNINIKDFVQLLLNNCK